MNKLGIALSTLLFSLLCGCSSTHNLNTDGFSPFGGGFSENQLQPGLYRLTAIGNRAPWPSFSAAIGTWKGRADQLCGKDAYQDIAATRDAGRGSDQAVYAAPGIMMGLPVYNTSISGYILCNQGGLTKAQAIRYLDDIAAAEIREREGRRKAELAAMGGSDCGDVQGPGISAETYLRRGKYHMGQNDYRAAMQCFMQAQAQDRTTLVYREACASIGTLYELGWGVSKDMPTAREWFRKAGLI